MKQLFSFLLFSLICTTAMAQRVVLDFTKKWNEVSVTKIYTLDGDTIQLGSSGHINLEEKDDANSHYLILKGTEGVNTATMTLPAFGFAVEKIEVVGNKDADKSVKQNIYVKSTAVSTETTGAKNDDGSAKTNVYIIKDGYQGGNNQYIIKVNSKNNAQITYVKIYGKDQTLTDSEDNTSAITEAQGKVVNATLTRTFDNDGWYTICLPFATTASAFGDDAKVEAYTSSSASAMIFKSTTTLEAGKPYLVWPSKIMENPTFDNVTITATSPETVGDAYTFVGTYSPIQLIASTDLFLGAGYQLCRPTETSGKLGGFRAYFKTPAGLAAKPALLVDGELLSINDVRDTSLAAGKVYTLQGQLVGTSTEGLPAGVYILNGRKIVVK